MTHIMWYSNDICHWLIAYAIYTEIWFGRRFGRFGNYFERLYLLTRVLSKELGID